MVFEGFKRKIDEFKEDRKFKQEVSADLKLRDELARQQARKQAKEQFADDRRKALEMRQAEFLRQEKQKLQPELERISDTRTSGQKFSEGLQKIGQKASAVSARVGQDVQPIGQQLGAQTQRIPRAVATTRLGQQPVQQRPGNIFFGPSEMFSSGKQTLQRETSGLKSKLGQTGQTADDKLRGFLGSSVNQKSPVSGSNISNLLGVNKPNISPRDKIRKFL